MSDELVDRRTTVPVRTMAGRSGGAPAATAVADGPSAHRPWHELLAGYDREVEASIVQALDAGSGLERVRALHNSVRPAVVVHDAVLNWAVCPVLEALPGGREVATPVRSGCRERAELLARFDRISRHVAAHNVYPVSGDEVERILEGIERSFTTYVREVAGRVRVVVDGASPGETEQLARSMALVARRAPTRSSSSARLPRSSTSLALARWRDRLEDWNDSHWNWLDRARATVSPRRELVSTLEDQPAVAPPSLKGVLEGFDAAIDAIIEELLVASTPWAKAAAAHRIVAAVAIHDSVVSGVLCPLLEAVPGGEAAARRLRSGCLERAELQQAWDALTREVSAADVYELRAPRAEELMEQMITLFGAHEREGTLEVSSLLAHLPDEAYRTRTSIWNDVMWPWYGEGPSLLALHMALWAGSAPTRAHPPLLRHPSSRILKSFYRVVDHFRDHWGDTWPERFFLPDLPARPFSRLSTETA